MLRKNPLLFLMLISLFGTPALANRDDNMVPAHGFFLPKGDIAAGKKAFADLKCNTCHSVKNAPDLESTVKVKAAPELGKRQAHYSRGWIANSIVSPSHTIVYDSDGMAPDSELSRMGDFTETMTVRQLIDLVEYIKSLDKKEKRSQKTGGVS